MLKGLGLISTSDNNTSVRNFMGNDHNIQRSTIGFFTLVLACFMLSACSNPQEPFEAYSQQVSNVLQRDISVEISSSYWPPEKRLVAIEVPSPTMSFYNSFQLNQCQLGALLAERNSSLGKVFLPANELIYETKVLQALPECIENETIGERLTAQLQEIQTLKEEQLPNVIHNFWVASEEMRNTFSSNSKILSLENSEQLEPDIKALEYFAHTLRSTMSRQGQISITNEAWVNNLQLLARSDRLPKLWRSLEVASEYLNSINHALDQHATQSTCSHVEIRRNEQLVNIFSNLFQGQIKPAINYWLKAATRLQPTIVALNSMTNSSIWNEYIDDLTSPEELQQALERHQEIINTLDSQCSQ